MLTAPSGNTKRTSVNTESSAPRGAAPSGIAPPSIGLMVKEAKAPLEWLGSVVTKPSVCKLPQGDQRHIILAPGFLTDTWSMRPLRNFLRRLNYVALD